MQQLAPSVNQAVHVFKVEIPHACEGARNFPRSSLQRIPNLGSAWYFVVPWALNSWIIISKSLCIHTRHYLRLFDDIILRSFSSVVNVCISHIDIQERQCPSLTFWTAQVKFWPLVFPSIVFFRYLFFFSFKIPNRMCNIWAMSVLV